MMASEVTRLAAAGLADQADHFAGVDCEGDAVDRVDVASVRAGWNSTRQVARPSQQPPSARSVTPAASGRGPRACASPSRVNPSAVMMIAIAG